jgi:pimeloyl-ACP methyl ester carboxylesterase
MLNILYIPGLLGSDLGFTTGPDYPPINIWLDLAQLATGGAVYLQLDADGVSPGPLARGIDLYATSIVAPVYSPLGIYLLLLGHDVFVVPYDWRKSTITSAAVVLAAAQEHFKGQPFYIVAHSQGGLVARAMWKLMFETGRDSQLLRLLTICTPQYGAMEAVRFYCRLPLLYTAIVTATGWPPTVLGEAGPDYIDKVLASWPGMVELLPFLAEGPLTTIDRAVAASIWKSGYYAGGNPYLTQTMLDVALSSQEYLLDAIPKGRMVSIIGTGQRTSSVPSGVGSSLLDAGTVYSDEGDGTITVASASLPGVPKLIVPGGHVTILFMPQVWQMIPYLLTGGL